MRGGSDIVEEELGDASGDVGVEVNEDVVGVNAEGPCNEGIVNGSENEDV